MYYIIIDLEANFRFDNPNSQHEIIEIGAIILNQSLTPIDTFQSFIKPRIHSLLSKTIRKKTKIEQHQINKAQDLNIILNNFTNWINSHTNDYIFCSWSISDYIMLKNNLKLYNIHNTNINLNNYCNIQEQLTIVNNLPHDLSLNKALKLLNITFTDQKHRALNDAIGASKVFIHIFNKITNLKICHLCLKTHELNKPCHNIILDKDKKQLFDSIIPKIKPGVPYANTALLKVGLSFNDIKHFVKYANVNVLKKKNAVTKIFGYDIDSYSENEIVKNFNKTP